MDERKTLLICQGSLAEGKIPLKYILFSVFCQCEKVNNIVVQLQKVKEQTKGYFYNLIIQYYSKSMYFLAYLCIARELQSL